MSWATLVVVDDRGHGSSGEPRVTGGLLISPSETKIRTQPESLDTDVCDLATGLSPALSLLGFVLNGCTTALAFSLLLIV